MKDIGDSVFKDGEVNLEGFLENEDEIEFDLTGYVEFDVLVKDGNVPLNKNKEKEE